MWEIIVPYFVPAVLKLRPTTVMDLIDDSEDVNIEQLVALVTLKLVDSESPPTTYNTSSY